ncbi:hypothetical protein HY990_00595 [Candidatus Micrarchaeota archaeon]|nr:hypothetical protein [Candidatus Micrarchaeota archaeon]
MVGGQTEIDRNADRINTVVTNILSGQTQPALAPEARNYLSDQWRMVYQSQQANGIYMGPNETRNQRAVFVLNELERLRDLGQGVRNDPINAEEMRIAQMVGQGSRTRDFHSPIQNLNHTISGLRHELENAGLVDFHVTARTRPPLPQIQPMHPTQEVRITPATVHSEEYAQQIFTTAQRFGARVVAGDPNWTYQNTMDQLRTLENTFMEAGAQNWSPATLISRFPSGSVVSLIRRHVVNGQFDSQGAIAELDAQRHVLEETHIAQRATHTREELEARLHNPNAELSSDAMTLLRRTNGNVAMAINEAQHFVDGRSSELLRLTGERDRLVAQATANADRQPSTAVAGNYLPGENDMARLNPPERVMTMVRPPTSQAEFEERQREGLVRADLIYLQYRWREGGANSEQLAQGESLFREMSQNTNFWNTWNIQQRNQMGRVPLVQGLEELRVALQIPQNDPISVRIANLSRGVTTNMIAATDQQTVPQARREATIRPEEPPLRIPEVALREPFDRTRPASSGYTLRSDLLDAEQRIAVAQERRREEAAREATAPVPTQDPVSLAAARGQPIPAGEVVNRSRGIVIPSGQTGEAAQGETSARVAVQTPTPAPPVAQTRPAPRQFTVTTANIGTLTLEQLRTPAVADQVTDILNGVHNDNMELTATYRNNRQFAEALQTLSRRIGPDQALATLRFRLESTARDILGPEPTTVQTPQEQPTPAPRRPSAAERAEQRRVEQVTQLVTTRDATFERREAQARRDLQVAQNELDAIERLIATDRAAALRRLTAVRRTIGSRDATSHRVTREGEIGTSLTVYRGNISGVISSLDQLHATDAEKGPIAGRETTRAGFVEQLDRLRDRAAQLEARARVAVTPTPAPRDLTPEEQRLLREAGTMNIQGGGPVVSRESAGWEESRRGAALNRERAEEERAIRAALRTVPSADLDIIIADLVETKHRLERNRLSMSTVYEGIRVIAVGSATLTVDRRVAQYRSEIARIVARLEQEVQ